MRFLGRAADWALGAFFSLIGFRDPIIGRDSSLLPHIVRALEDTPYAGISIGDPVPGRNWEHAVRFLGDDFVIKYVSPEPLVLMTAWVQEIREQGKLLQEHLPAHMVSTEYFLVPLPDGQATYAVVMRRVRGKSLLALTDEALFSNRTTVANLLNFFINNRKLRADHGVSVDAVGGTALKILNPRYTNNLFVTGEGRVLLVDTVLIPRHFNTLRTPAKYRTCFLYRLVNRLLVRPFESRFMRRLETALAD